MRRTATIAAVALAMALGGFSLDWTRPTSVVANAAMPDPGLTGAPPSGSNCYTCHNGGLNDGLGIIQIYNVPQPYVPGQTYTLLVLLANLTDTRWGFELTALKSDNTMAGSFQDNSAAVGEQSQGGIDYVSQTTLEGFDGTYSDSTGAAWVFQWTAPPQGAGPVTFYAAGAACDKDGTANSGDFTYTASVATTEGASTDVKAVTWGKIKQIYR
jgi:hypothetical protein